MTADQEDKVVEDFLKHQAQVREMCRTFWNSPRKVHILELLKKEVDKYGSIGDNLYQEPLFGDVSNEEFIMLFECLFDPEIIKLELTETGELFWQESVVYEEMEFVQIHGQGTAFIVKRLQ